MALHSRKKGVRVLGVAESFKPGDASSVLAGVVMRGDLVVDGAELGRTSVGGDDATARICSLYKRLKRNDVNAIVVSGCVLSLYNIVDADALAAKTRAPVLCLTYRESSGIEESIRRRFPDRSEGKLRAYRGLGARKRLMLASGKPVFVRTSGMSDGQALDLLNLFTLQGSVPEPVRVAKILARAASRRSSRRG